MASMDVYDLRELPAGERIMIYGTGSAGLAFMHLARSMRRDVVLAGFLDSFASGEKQGLPVYRPEELAPESYDRIVVCSYKKDEIFDRLRELGLGACYEFVPLRTRVENERAAQCCPLEQLYIRYDGTVLPCCYQSRCDAAVIGRIGDPDLAGKALSFDMPGCSCESFVFKPYSGGEPRFRMITVETSLLCQAECAMCCVHAPGWTGTYDIPGGLANFLEEVRPMAVHFQGGEVLIQKQVMDWIPSLKKRLPDTSFLLLTNGGVPASMAAKAGDIFDKIWFTLSGMQPDTYRFVMGLDFERTMGFLQALHARPDVQVWVKFLIVPSTIHETGRFLRWAAAEGFPGVGVDVALKMGDYLGFETGDKYWAKIMDRVSLDVRRVLVEERDRFLAQGQRVDFTVGARNFLNIPDEFVRENGLDKVLISNHEDWKRWSSRP